MIIQSLGIKSIQKENGLTYIEAINYTQSLERCGRPKENKMKFFAGPSNPQLSKELCANLGETLGNVILKKFSDGEPYVEYKDSVRGHHVVIIQGFPEPFETNLMFGCLMAYGAKKNGAKDITMVVPYFGGARQDRRVNEVRSATTAAWVAQTLWSSGVTQLVTVDIHSPTIIEGAFPGPSINEESKKLLVADIMAKNNLQNSIIVSPDPGGGDRANRLADELVRGVAICYKRRIEANQIKEMKLLGKIEGKDIIIVDDMFDTCGTLAECVKEVKKHGARKVVAYATHGVFSGNALKRIEDSELEEVVVTSSIEKIDKKTKSSSSKIRTISVTPVLVEAMHRAMTFSK